MTKEPVPVTVIVLTYNESLNIADCLRSVCGWASEVFVVDSYSTDDTVEIARQYARLVVQHELSMSVPDQRCWALENLPLKTDWVLFVDADERIRPELREEIATILLKPQELLESGFYIKRRFYFLGRWLRHGDCYPNAELRLFRRDRTRAAVARGYWESYAVEGRVGVLKGDMDHVNQKGLSAWTQKHTRYARYQAEWRLRPSSAQNESRVVEEAEPLQVRRKRWIRRNIWDRLPLFVRPFLLFTYRYIMRLGFLDGAGGLCYCLLHDLWFPLLVDAMYREAQLTGSGVRNENSYKEL
jgi:glycosyltransferase involved in cell wall biosynthesis